MTSHELKGLLNSNVARCSLRFLLRCRCFLFELPMNDCGNAKPKPCQSSKLLPTQLNCRRKSLIDDSFSSVNAIPKCCYCTSGVVVWMKLYCRYQQKTTPWGGEIFSLCAFCLLVRGRQYPLVAYSLLPSYQKSRYLQSSLGVLYQARPSQAATMYRRSFSLWCRGVHSSLSLSRATNYSHIHEEQEGTRQCLGHLRSLRGPSPPYLSRWGISTRRIGSPTKATGSPYRLIYQVSLWYLLILVWLFFSMLVYAAKVNPWPRFFSVVIEIFSKTGSQQHWQPEKYVCSALEDRSLVSYYDGIIKKFM